MNEYEPCDKCGGTVYMPNPSAHACPAERPDAAPPKDDNEVLPKVCPKCHTIYSKVIDRCPVCWDELQTFSPVSAAPPSDAAPVAWRWRRTDLPQEPECQRWVYWYPGDPAHHDPRRNDLAGRDDIEVQAVYVRAYPEDAPGGPTRLQILEAQRELTAADLAFPHEDGTYSLLLSDTFDFATADAERIPDDEVVGLAQLYKDHGHFALIVWAEDKRGQRVIKPLRDDVDKMRDRLKGDEKR